MPNQYYVEPANPLQALMLGRQAYNEADQQAKEAEREAIYKQAGLDIQNGGFTNSVYGKLFGIGPQAAPLIGGAAALQKAKAEANQVYGTPIYGTGPNGEPLVGAITKQGELKNLQTPGFTVAPGIKAIDTGTGTVLVDSKAGRPIGGQPNQAPGGRVDISGNPVAGVDTNGNPIAGAPGSVAAGRASPYIPKDVQGESAAKKTGLESADRLAEYGKAKAAYDGTVSNLDRLAMIAKQVSNHPGLSGITGIQSKLYSIPGGNAANAQAKLDALKAQVGFSALQAMRDASKTGGALGSITEKEHPLLQAQIDALDQAQSMPEFKKALQSIVDYTEGVKTRAKQAFQQDYERLKTGQPVQQPQTQPQTPQGVVDFRTYFGGQ